MYAVNDFVTGKAQHAVKVWVEFANMERVAIVYPSQIQEFPVTKQ